MPLTVNWNTRVISVPQSYLAAQGGNVYQLDVNQFRLDLRDIEDGEGVPFPPTHRHNTAVTLAGVTYARTVELINGYTVSFENTGTPYTIKCVGANHNIGDVTNYSGNESLVIGNAAGLIVVTQGSGVTDQDKTDIATRLLDLADTIEGDLTVRGALRLALAALAGKVAGGAGPTTTFRNVGDTKDRITATVTEDGDRTAVTVDAT